MRVPFIIPDGGGFVKLDAGWIFRYHGPDDEVMTMQYLCAPMEGVTGDLFRQAQRQTFPAADSYYTLFLSPTANRTFSPRELREIEPAHNAGIRVVPQLMGHCAEDFLWMAGQLADMGYDEVNFNLGCPSNTVTVKKKGRRSAHGAGSAAAVFRRRVCRLSAAGVGQDAARQDDGGDIPRAAGAV